MIGLSLPPVIKNLLIINVLFFLATAVGGGQFLMFDIREFFALHHYTSDLFWPHQYITYQFLHANMSHLFFNMFALWMFGGNIERVMGPKRFLMYYMGTAIGAGIIHSIVFTYDIANIQSAMDLVVNNPTPINFKAFLETANLNTDLFQNFLYEWTKEGNSEMYSAEAITMIQTQGVQLLQRFVDTPMVGASGAVFGLLLAFGMIFPNQEILLSFIIPMKAKYFVVIYGIAELYYGVANNPGDNIAHFAHLGGMIVGFILIKYWRSKGQLYS